MKIRTPIIAGLAAVALVVVAACTSAPPQTNAQEAARQNDQRTSAEALQQLQQNQPTPVFDYSQLRQNLIELVTAQANSTATTTFFFLEGVDHPIDQCPSIGAPIPSTMQLTNPESVSTVEGGQYNAKNPYTLPQVEPTGVYTGQSSGTYVICIDSSGQAYANYWEGYTKTVFGPAEWSATDKQVKITGAPTFDFSEGR